MFSRIVILSALVATVAADAIAHPAHVAKAELHARQTNEAESTKCTNDLMSVYALSPTPPPEIFSYQKDHPLTDWCGYSVPSSLGSMYSSYESAVSSWAGLNQGPISALASSCPIFSAITVWPPCWTAAPAAATAKPNVTSAGTNSRSSGNAGARETGMIAAAVAAAGLLGAVAAL